MELRLRARGEPRSGGPEERRARRRAVYAARKAVHLPDGLTPELHERLVVIAGMCPVHRALGSGLESAHWWVRAPRTPIRAAA